MAQLPHIFDSLFQYTSDLHNTRYSSKQNLRINVSEQTMVNKLLRLHLLTFGKTFLNNLKT
jgi:hypothetical protein